MDKQLADYRSHLLEAEQKAQEDFDKAVLSLSGGALGISFVFVKDIVGTAAIVNPGLLFTAWICWGFSVTFVLASFFTSHLALRYAIKQVDEGTVRIERPGGLYDLFTGILNALGGPLFLVGIIVITLFVRQNLGFN